MNTIAEPNDLTFAGAVAARLARLGISHVFAIPGTHNLELFRALQQHGIVIVPAHHEQGLGYAADGYARATGRPAVVLTTTGPGITNLITALATSAAASVPVLAIAPGLPSAALGGGTGWLHELPSQLGVLSQVVRSHRAESAEDAVGFIDSCEASWERERPLPAYLELPLDRLDEPCEPSIEAVRAPASEPASGQPGTASRPLRDDDLSLGARALAGAARPLIIAGRGACFGDAPAHLLRLAERLGAPVITTANAKGVIDERHPLAVGVALRSAPARRLITASDLVLVVGSDLGRSEFWGPSPLTGMTVLRIDVDERLLFANASPAPALLGRSEEILPRLADRVEEFAGSAPIIGSDGAAPAWAAPMVREIRTALERDGLAYRTFHAILQEETDGGSVIITGDSSRASYFGSATFWRSEAPNRFLYPAGYGTLGYAVPAAVGASLAGVADRVIAITGEGGLLFSVQELATVGELGLPIITIVFSNGGYEEIREGMRSLGIAEIGVDFPGPDFSLIAGGFRMRGVAIVADGGAESRFREEIRAALESGAPTLIDVRLG